MPLSVLTSDRNCVQITNGKSTRMFDHLCAQMLLWERNSVWKTRNEIVVISFIVRNLVMCQSLHTILMI